MTAPRYRCLRDYGFGENSKPDALQSSPDWCVAVYRFLYPTTFSRKAGGSFSRNWDDAVALVNNGKPLIIRSGITSISAESSKSTHNPTLRIRLVAETDAANRILSEDWIMAWMAPNKKTIDEVVRKLKNGEPANGFDSGFKFLGRVRSCTESMMQNPDGTRVLGYDLIAQGGTEFGASIFYDPHLAEKEGFLGETLSRWGLAISELEDSNRNGMPTDKLVPRLVDLLLGSGVPKSLGVKNDDPNLQSTTGLEASHSFIVPAAIAQVLGVQQSDRSKDSFYSAADLIQLLHGRAGVP